MEAASLQCIALCNGEPCGSRALAGRLFCAEHDSPAMPERIPEPPPGYRSQHVVERDVRVSVFPGVGGHATLVSLRVGVRTETEDHDSYVAGLLRASCMLMRLAREAMIGPNEAARAAQEERATAAAPMSDRKAGGSC